MVKVKSDFLFFSSLSHCPAHSDSCYLSFLISDPPVELFAVDAEKVLSGMDDTTLDGYGPGCVYVVSSHHAHCNACTLALLDGIGNLHQDRLTHAQNDLVLQRYQHTVVSAHTIYLRTYH